MRALKLILAVVVLFLLCGCPQSRQEKLSFITVGILPQKYFVQKIIGEDFSVQVMLSPGQSPATYQPLPSQMKKLGKSLIYFQMGLPFEKRWMKKIAEANKKMEIVDLRKGLALREIEGMRFSFKYSFAEEKKSHVKAQRDKKNPHYHTGKDPHTWLSPILVKEMAQTIYQTVIKLKSDKKELYKTNLTIFLHELDEVTKYISNQFVGIKQKEILVFHPAWGYFCDAFGLKQIPIEIKGKSPNARDLVHLIDSAQKMDIKTIFIQSQFSTLGVEAIAREINAKIVKINPLSEDYLTNLLEIAFQIRSAIDSPN